MAVWRLAQERDTPTFVLELPAKGDRIVHFAWEPHVRFVATPSCFPSHRDPCKMRRLPDCGGRLPHSAVELVLPGHVVSLGDVTTFAWSLHCKWQHGGSKPATDALVGLLQGTRFAILHGDGLKPQLSIYDMKVRLLPSSGREVSLLPVQLCSSRHSRCLLTAGRAVLCQGRAAPQKNAPDSPGCHGLFIALKTPASV